jgi:hypothetical protein
MPALEEAFVQRVADLLEVEESTFGREALVGVVTLLADARLLALDELVQHPTGLGPSATRVVGHRLDHRPRRVEEHVVQPEPQRRGGAPEADHRAPVVGDRQSHRHPQVTSEVLGQRGGLVNRDLAGGHPGAGAHLRIEQEKLTRRRIAHGTGEEHSTAAAPGAIERDDHLPPSRRRCVVRGA